MEVASRYMVEGQMVVMEGDVLGRGGRLWTGGGGVWFN